METVANVAHREPWNKGKIVGQKAPFKLRDIWALRVRFQMENRVRELALFNLGIDSKLRGCDLVSLKVRDICHGDQVASRAVVMQHKTQRPVQFEITPATRDAVQKWIKQAGLKSDGFVFPSRIHDSPHLGTRQYARILEGWVESEFLDPPLENSGVLPRAQMRRVVNPTGEDEVVSSEACLLDPFLHSVAGCRRDLELHRTLRLVLHHHRARCHLVAMADVSDLETDEITAAELAVDSQVEECKLAHSVLHLQADSKSPDVPDLERRLLSDDLALVPWLAMDSLSSGIHDGLPSN